MLFTAFPARAITYGQPDGSGHPFVGALIAEWRTPGVKQELCSGTLISPTVFLTAAHCTAYLESLGIPNDEVWVSFDQDIDPVTASTSLHRGWWVTNPNYRKAQSDPGDLAVILFPRAITGISPASLPPARLFYQMAVAGRLTGQKFTAVGYGGREPQTGRGAPTYPIRWGGGGRPCRSSPP